MASVEFDELSGRYRIRFRYGGYPSLLVLQNAGAANGQVVRRNHVRSMLSPGLMTVREFPDRPDVAQAARATAAWVVRA